MVVRCAKTRTRQGPSSMSRNNVFSLPEEWGGRDCLLKIKDLSVVPELKEELGGDALRLMLRRYTIHWRLFYSLSKTSGLYSPQCYH